MAQNYSIFGAGPAGLYTAWRLIKDGKLGVGDKVNLYEWATYDFEGTGEHRQPAGRICSHHYKDDLSSTYIEIGGMRFIEWDGHQFEIDKGVEIPAKGHRLVTTAIQQVGLSGDIVDFLTTDNPLYYLRGEHFYEKDLGSGPNDVKAPYKAPGNNAAPPTKLTTDISDLITGTAPLVTRQDQCAFYAHGTLPSNFNSFVYRGGENASNVGYWNIFYDQAGNEGFNYAADAGGYNSNVINWNAANAAIYNGEFAPGGTFKTISGGYSRLFSELYNKTVAAAAENGVNFILSQGTRLHSIWTEGDDICYRLATASDANKAKGETLKTDVAFLAMPPESVDIVAQATRYENVPGRTDFLNNSKVANYLEAVIEQPSYKVAMFFDTPWWEDSKYPPKLVSDGQTESVFGPTITDLPLRQVYYFGNNAQPHYSGEAVYGLLASYDDERFVGFWRGLELPTDVLRETAVSRDLQPLQGGRDAPVEMERMLLLQLAKLHYGDPDAAHSIPTPKATAFMDWGLNPFGAGYHAWAPHYDIGDVMQTLRAPAKLAGVNCAQVYLIGSAYSNDQAWVEGAFCTAESVLVDFLKLEPLIDTTVYKLICS